LSTFSRRINIGTDVAHILIFHPDDLSHAAEWPIAWYSDPAVYPVENAAGRLMGWSTQSDGGYMVRVTDGALTDAEKAAAGPSWTFPLTVRHGRVFVDNSDGLPGQEQMLRPADYPDQWVEVPNGSYAVTVTGIEWDGSDDMPNYVVSFVPADAPPPSAARPPDLPPLKDGEASDALYYSGRSPTLDTDTPVEPAPYPAFVGANVNPLYPGNFTSTGEAPLEEALRKERRELFDQPVVVAARIDPDAPAVIAKINGAGGAPGKPKRFSLRARRLVRITQADGMFHEGRHQPLPTKGLLRRKTLPLPDLALHAVRIAPWDVAPDTPLSTDLEDLRDRVLSALKDGPLAAHLGGLASYETLQVRALQADGVPPWLIRNLPLSASERLRLAGLAPNAQATGAAQALDAMK